jgi:hypothetical protein
MNRATTKSIYAVSAVAIALGTATLTTPRPAQAAPYWPWCVQNSDRSNAHYCGFISWEQCMETARGARGGYCYHNLESPPPVANRSARARDHAARD